MTVETIMETEHQPLLLVVDDNDDNRYILTQRLKRDGYTNILEAADGSAALELLSARPVDLVFLDVLMPNTDGFQVLERMRSDSRLRNIPVIVISAVDDEESILHCIESGADDYLPKPFNTPLLRARIRSSLEKKRLRDESMEKLGEVNRTFGKYLPQRVAEAIVAGQGEPQPVHAEATILYTDIEDFTRISASMQPQQVVEMLNEYFEAVNQPITELGGVVTQFQGDAMLVSFNLPVPDRRHADRALRAAARIQQIMKTRKFAGVSLRTRIGINSGEVLAGSVGGGDRLTYTVHGDAVNMAARLENLNKEFGSEVLISGETVRQLADIHPIEALGRVAIRGKTSDTEVYRLQAA